MTATFLRSARCQVAVAVLSVVGLVGWYLLPVVAAREVGWIRPNYHPEWYSKGLVFTGYAFPSLLLALWLIAVLPRVFSLPAPAQSVVNAASTLALLLAFVLCMFFAVWICTTSIF